LIQQGDADVARELGADQITALQNQPGVKVIELPSAEQNYLAFNTGNSANPLLNNPAFWQAARYLVDYQGITKDLLKGQYFIHQSFLPVGFPGALENNPFSFDPAKAKAILEQAGITNASLTLDVENKPPFITIAQSLQASFAQAGVKLDLLPAAGSQVYARVRAKQHQAAIRLWLPDYFDAHSNASTFAYNDGKGSTVAGLNGWQIPELSQQTLAAIAEADPAKRTALYTAMQQELQRSSPYVFIDQAKKQLVLRDNVKGYQQGLNADMVYYDRVSK
jgi:peptide/nickel transport system substrate-binding protein